MSGNMFKHYTYFPTIFEDYGFWVHIAFSSGTDMVDLSFYFEINMCDRTKKHIRKLKLN